MDLGSGILACLGGVEALEDVLLQFVKRKSFLKYPSSPEAVDTKVPKYLPLLRSLWARQSNLSFKKREVIAAFKGVASKHGFQLSDPEQWAIDQTEAMSKWRRRLAQGLLKSPGKWMELLKEPQSQRPYDEWTSQALEERSETANVVFNRELHTVYRVTPQGASEFCQALVIPEVWDAPSEAPTYRLGSLASMTTCL